MSVRPLHIVSININRQSALLHALLQTSDADVLLIQEPWHGTVNVDRSDHDPLGTHILGVTANNQWQIYYPKHSPDERCLVVTYVKTQIDKSVSVVNHLSHPLASASSMVLDIVTGRETLRLVNVYHQVPRDEPGHHSLSHILSSELDQGIPTLFMGDLNTHSIYWSLPHSRTSPWADDLVDWFDEQGLHLQNPEGVPTWESNRDDDSLRPSVIDLALLNPAAIFSDQFSDLSISFDESLSTDHATLSMYWFPEVCIAIRPRERLPGFAIDDDGRDLWTTTFSSFPHPPISDIESLKAAADALSRDIDAASSTVFKPRMTPHPHGVRWWNTSCDAALDRVRLSAKGRDRKHAMRELRNIIGNAKRSWAHDYLNEATLTNLWEAAQWRKGRSVTRIPPILTTSGLSAEPTNMATAFASRFFLPDPTPIPTHHADDPEPTPTRDLVAITAHEISAALGPTSNKSAPGWSGIGYKLLKWAFAAQPLRFVTLFNQALTLGYHPWKEAKVVVLAKPQRPDYSMPKAYRPISLLECCGKLLEKIVASRLLHDLNLYSLLPPNQFGSRDYHCTVDAVMCLMHHAEAAIATGHTAALILFDIQGFFDNINVDRLVSIMTNLGFPSAICAWTLSFLTDRRVRLTFNGFTSEAATISHGTPQGSPLSPILSAIYTLPLLKLINRTWVHRGLQTYVDDGAIIATHVTHKGAIKEAAQGVEEVTAWLARNGLKTDPDKTEFLLFYKRKRPNQGSIPSSIGLRDPINGEYTVKRSMTVRYLGIFISHNLSFDHHIKVMATRAKSTVQAINILGNSVRGLDLAGWRKIYHALVLPVLTYGLPLYASRIRKGAVKVLQVAQNAALRKICGVFKTTPVEPLPYMSAILPMSVYIPMALAKFEDRLSRLPPTHMLRTLPSSCNAVARYQSSLEPRTCITRLAPSINFSPPFSFPAHPALHRWNHNRLREVSSLTPSETAHIDARRHFKTPSYDTFQIVMIHPNFSHPSPSPLRPHLLQYMRQHHHQPYNQFQPSQ